MISIMERSIEAKHALVKMALYDAGLKGSTVKIYFANRLPEMRAAILREPRVLEEVLECFQEVRNHSLAPGKFGLEFHPLFLELHNKHHSKFTKPLCAVLYRADVWSSLSSLTN